MPLMVGLARLGLRWTGLFPPAVMVLRYGVRTIPAHMERPAFPSPPGWPEIRQRETRPSTTFQPIERLYFLISTNPNTLLAEQRPVARASRRRAHNPTTSGSPFRISIRINIVFIVVIEDTIIYSKVPGIINKLTETVANQREAHQSGGHVVNSRANAYVDTFGRRNDPLRAPGSAAISVARHACGARSPLSCSSPFSVPPVGSTTAHARREHARESAPSELGGDCIIALISSCARHAQARGRALDQAVGARQEDHDASCCW